MYQSDIKHDNPSLAEKLEYLYTLRADKNPTKGLRSEYLELLKELGSPHLHLPPTIHVAGTNGKGSTIAYMRAILEAAGHSVHVYTSPHLVKFNERIVLAGQQIDDQTLEFFIDEALEANAGQSLSFFEITTAIALKAFATYPADYVLLETGLGGRLDCTNVIEYPVASVITNIGYDHQEFLGETLEDIAREKAGIIKQGGPCFIGDIEGDALGVIEKIADDKDALLLQLGEELQGDEGYQLQNRALARTIMRHIGIDEHAIKKGIENFKWPARLQQITKDGAWTIYLDGGHNADAAVALSRQMQKWKSDGNEVHIIIGMMAHKDHFAFIKPISAFADSIQFIDIPDESQAMSAKDLYGMLCDTQTYDEKAGYQSLINDIKQNHNGGKILICGSLYLAGHVLKTEGLM